MARMSEAQYPFYSAEVGPALYFACQLHTRSGVGIGGKILELVIFLRGQLTKRMLPLPNEKGRRPTAILEGEWWGFSAPEM